MGDFNLVLLTSKWVASVDLRNLTSNGLGRTDLELYWPKQKPSFIALVSNGMFLTQWDRITAKYSHTDVTDQRVVWYHECLWM